MKFSCLSFLCQFYFTICLIHWFIGGHSYSVTWYTAAPHVFQAIALKHGWDDIVQVLARF